jgi:putative redox protein
MSEAYLRGREGRIVRRTYGRDLTPSFEMPRRLDPDPAGLGNTFSCNKFQYFAFIGVAPNQRSLREAPMITAKVLLTQPLRAERQFAATTGSEHHMLLDDAAGGTGSKPIELVAVALAGCTAFDVITILRQKYHQKVTGYEVRLEAEQAERPPQVFTDVRIHHVVRGYEIDSAAIEEGIRLSEEKYCSVGAMVKKTASLHTTYEIVEERTQWLAPTLATVHG